MPRIAGHDMKLMGIDSDALGIPETGYEARVTMLSSEFTCIILDLSQLGERLYRGQQGRRPVLQV